LKPGSLRKSSIDASNIKVASGHGMAHLIQDAAKQVLNNPTWATRKKAIDTFLEAASESIQANELAMQIYDILNPKGRRFADEDAIADFLAKFNDEGYVQRFAREHQIPDMAELIETIVKEANDVRNYPIEDFTDWFIGRIIEKRGPISIDLRKTGKIDPFDSSHQNQNYS